MTHRPGFLMLVFVLALTGLLVHFSESFPNGWDQTEYCWALAANYLPHAPYLLFYGVGEVFALLVTPVLALSLLSLASGVGLLIGFFKLQRALIRNPENSLAPFIGTVTLGLSFIFVRQAVTQEIYLFASCLLMWSAVCLERLRAAGGGRFIGAGILVGLTLAAHPATSFAVPALLLLLVAGVSQHRSADRLPLVIRSLGSAFVVLGVLSLVLDLLLPRTIGGFTAAFAGTAPAIAWGQLSLQGLVSALAELVGRVVDLKRPFSRAVVASEPTGFWWTHIALMVSALLGSCTSERVAVRFWCVLLVPYVVYEAALGVNPDYGLYLLQVLPALSALAALGSSRLLSRIRGSWAQQAITLTLLTVALLGPSLMLFYRHWQLPARERAQHLSVPTLVARSAAVHTPAEAVIIQAAEEWNVNLLPYYSGRRPIVRSAGRLFLFEPQGQFTPLNYHAFRALTPDLFRRLLRDNVPVFALNAQPFSDAALSDFADVPVLWQPITVPIDGQEVIVYRGQLTH